MNALEVLLKELERPWFEGVQLIISDDHEDWALLVVQFWKYYLAKMSASLQQNAALTFPNIHADGNSCAIRAMFNAPDRERLRIPCRLQSEVCPLLLVYLPGWKKIWLNVSLLRFSSGIPPFHPYHQ